MTFFLWDGSIVLVKYSHMIEYRILKGESKEYHLNNVSKFSSIWFDQAQSTWFPMALNENLKKCNLRIFRSKLENFKKINDEQNTISMVVI